jgi:DNA-binding NarL/FixJ family response regulator
VLLLGLHGPSKLALELARQVHAAFSTVRLLAFADEALGGWLLPRLLDLGLCGWLPHTTTPADVRDAVVKVSNGALLLPAPDPRAGPALWAALTPRERDVAMLLCRGLSNREMATELTLVDKTVERHISGLFAKIGARSAREAIALLLRPGGLPAAALGCARCPHRAARGAG